MEMWDGGFEEVRLVFFLVTHSGIEVGEVGAEASLARLGVYYYY